MGVTTKKYGVSVSFYRKMAFFVKTIWILSQNLNFLKPIKTDIQDHYA
jgi:hypothetical protein